MKLDYENYPVIAAVRSDADFEVAISSEVQTVFLLKSNIIEVESLAKRAHEKGKLLFLHVDFVDGLSKDAAGVRYLSTKGIDGIISTRTGVISAAKEVGITCIQRFFMVDSRSVDTALEALKQSKADLIEIMPALAYKSITKMKNSVATPIIAGGLIEFKEEVYSALSAGASMISTGKKELWVD
ncbi:MAG: glycerol-3-phosphate responsive antiterminator [Clostridia bacterium]|nr:glycerol-3-phosphate responsive antiterminator [Clostridia bacterium]